MKISVLAGEFMKVPPVGLVLTDDQVLRSLRDATRFYCAYADLDSGEVIDESALGKDEPVQELNITISELGLIKPLWLLYMERENSTTLEASRSMGADPYGRSVAEVQASITEYEQRLPALAFTCDFVSIN